MKMYNLKMPVRLASHLAKWTFENSVRIILTYTQDEFFDANLIAICAVEEGEKETAFSAEFGKYFSKAA